MDDHDWEVIQTMKEFGGSFVRALAEAFLCADSNNVARLKAAFPDYWAQYEDFAAMKKGK
jgi:hypothetical protein